MSEKQKSFIDWYGKNPMGGSYIDLEPLPNTGSLGPKRPTDEELIRAGEARMEEIWQGTKKAMEQKAPAVRQAGEIVAPQALEITEVPD